MSNRGQIIQLLPPMGSLSKDHSDGIGSEKTNIWEMVTILWSLVPPRMLSYWQSKLQMDW